MKRTEQILGVILLIAIVVGGGIIFGAEKNNLYFSLLMGLSLGYVLTRAWTGFAGAVNRAYNTGSTALMRAMMFMFFITAVGVSGLLIFKPEAVNYDLWINPINGGLIVGGLLFGFGMSFSSCCASGVMTDLVTGLPRGLITLIFFMIGVFVGFPVQNKTDFVKESWFKSSEGLNGVSIADWFKFDNLNGYLGAVIFTGLLALIVAYFAKKYEEKRRLEGTYLGVETENFALMAHSEGTYESNEYSSLLAKVVTKPWTLKQGAIALSFLFIVMTAATKEGWGASTPFGIWIGQLLYGFGVTIESITNFTGHAVDANPFIKPFFAIPVTVQNIGIVLGTLVYLLLDGKFKKVFTSELKISTREGLFYALGGLSMGFGTRLSNGCNVGALYTPIANFSLSGWIFFVVMIVGAIIGNKVFHKK